MMIRFNEQDHIYFDDDGLVYLSGTKFIKAFVKPFDKQKVAARYAKKNKKPIQDVLSEWDELGRVAIEKGVAYHKLREEELYSRDHVDIEGELHPIYKCDFEGELKVAKSLKLGPGVYPELIVWSDKYKIAGQADYVEITKSGKLNITDYKTSKEIKKHGHERWDGSYQKMLFPLHNLDDCNFNQYALQINLYALLIKMHNKDVEIGELKIQHIAGSFDSEKRDFTVDNIVNYPVPNLQREIKIALEYHNNKYDQTL